MRFAGPAARASYAVGVVVDDDSTVLYLCGTTDVTRPHSEWFTIDDDGRVSARIGAVDRGHADVTASGVSGTLGLPDQGVLDFSVPLVEDTSLGLFSVVDSGCRAGVVAYPGGSAGTWCSSDGRFEQVTPIQPIDASSLLVRIGSQPHRELRVDAVSAAAFR